jgi:hypothetical protein
VTPEEETAYWKGMARKHERRAKEARRLARRLLEEIRVPSADPRQRVRELEEELDALYAEKRGLSTGVGEPFIRSHPNAAGTQEIIVARSRKRPTAAEPVNRHG